MPTAIIGAVGVGAGLFSANEQKKAQEKAVGQQQRAAIQNVQFLQQQGRIAEEFIGEQARKAELEAQPIVGRAIAPLQQFADIGGQAFGQARRDILTGRARAQTPLTQRISQAATRAVTDQPGFDLSDPVMAALQRQAGLTGQAIQPAITQQQLGIGGIGLAAAGDIAGIRQRGAERVGDIARQAAGQRATSIIGQAPAVASQIQAGQEARILSGLPGQQFGTNVAEQVARLAGRIV